MTTLFYRRVRDAVEALGGFHNAHLHLDRANTLDDGFVDHGRLSVMESSHISLQKKHALIQTVHEGPAYDKDNLLARVADTTDVMIRANTKIADTMVDVTPDRVGLTALDWMMDYAASVADKITIRSAAYTPLGFKDSEPERWRIFEEGVAKADFIGSLPEADDVGDYPDNIGFEEHCVRVLDLVKRTGKMVHVHTDQRNIPQEDGTERLIDVMRREGGALSAPDGSPLVWAVHMISPSTYDDARWQAFVEGMLECNIGVISCPSAAIGMRAIRPVMTPNYNAIPRILELACAGVPIRLGSDNVADMCSPSTTADLMDEVFMLSAAIRFFQPELLAKLACGADLSADDKAAIADHLEKNDAEVGKVVRRWTQP
jgi:cytosine/adenosine deaminase-related metal-dependent hydrolase